MNLLLLDTNALLGWLFELPVLGKKARQLVRSENSTVFVSSVSAAEIAIKSALGKLEAPDDLEDALAASAFVQLPLTVRHGLGLRELPRLHGDPFDRLLVAQARCEGLTIVTSDKKLAAYDVSLVDARE